MNHGQATDSASKAQVGGCTGDCGKAPRGSFCCYVWRADGAPAWNYGGFNNHKAGTCIAATEHYNREKASVAHASGAFVNKLVTKNYKIPSDAIDTFEECREFASKLGPIDPPMPS
jgi:hypothetical protein